MRFLPLALILMAASAAQAQYKCTSVAGVTFQQTPCPKEATERQVGPKPPAPAPKPYISPNRPAHIREAFEQGLIVAGMTWDEVFTLNGNQIPDKVNTTVTANGRSQQQVYRRNHRTLYVYLTNDVVTAVQSIEH